MSTEPRISISICPTRLEFSCGDVMNDGRYLDRIKQAVLERWPSADIRTLQIGYRQGDDWATIDGADSDELQEVCDSVDTSDESLYDAEAVERIDLE